MKKDFQKNLERIQKDLVDFIKNQKPTTVEDQMIHDLLFSIELIRDAKFDVVELRILNSAIKELRHSFKVFKDYYKVPKAAVFGSARTPADHPDYKIAKQFGKEMTKRGWMVITGGASGIMEAAMVGAGAKHSFGLNILLPFEQDANPVIKGSRKLMYFKYFFTRKLMFLKESAATVLFPGGFGTFDEGFESLTLIQTGKARPRPVMLVDPPGSSYWDKCLGMLDATMQENGWISPGDLDLMRHVQDPAKAADEITQFYSNYHSSRFFKDEYLVQVNKKIKPKDLKLLNDEYKDIVVAKGKFRRHTSDDQVMEEGASDKIIFPFDRVSYGRLRSLVDTINSF